MKKPYFLFLFLFSVQLTSAQPVLTKAPGLRLVVDDQRQALIFAGVNSLFSQIKQGKIDAALIGRDDSALNKSIFFSFHGMEDDTRNHKAGAYDMQIINCYPVSDQQYVVSIVFQGVKTDSAPMLKSIITLIADTHDGNVAFATPLAYLTRNWKRKEVGNITYYYEGEFHGKVAKAFDRNNLLIARRLGLIPEKFRFYLCDNYQNILQLLGYSYDWGANGRIRDGYGIDAHTIFSVMRSEDFSHDTFHYYAAKVRTGSKRNSAAEEGLAYSWGNAYYTDQTGQMISLPVLAKAIGHYRDTHPSTSLWLLFNDNPKLFNDLAKEISVKSVISGLLCDEVERQKGMEGVKALINCGAGDANYLQTIDNLIGINKENFDEKVNDLLNRSIRKQ